MSLLSPKTLIAVVSLGAVLGAAVVDFGRTSPGALISAHGRIEGLEAKNGCSDCHGGWGASMTSSCLECHGVIEQHIRSGKGLHGTMDDGLVAGCAACHSDHHGATFQAVNALSFARAGVGDIQTFEHRLVDFAMDGAHLDLECDACHTHAFDEVVPTGAHRFVGLAQGCVSCHEDVHEGAMQSRCVDCHSQTSFDDHAFVDHAAHLELVGGHAGLSCRECHAEASTHSIEALRGPAAARPAPRSCTACHESPHGNTFLVKAARTAGVPSPARFIGPEAVSGPPAHALCTTCHLTEHLAFDEDAENLSAELHLASGFPLTLPHGEVTCAECHDGGETFEERYPGRAPGACAACHDDPHAGQFSGLAYPTGLALGALAAAPGTFAGGDVDAEGCTVCHQTTTFSPHTFGPEAHAATDLALTGAHEALECAACHGLDEAGVRTFHPTAHACEACHADAHEGFFDARLAELATSLPAHGDCARCHTPETFSGASGGAFDHAEWTGYALTGAHAAAECTSCHAPSSERDSTGRLFGRVEEIYGEVNGCASCHDDVHGGRFDGKGMKRKVEGRRDCARCHTTASFRDLAHGFDHGQWTGWRLRDAHAEADCTACHQPLRRPDELGRTWAHAAGTDCASCHDSPHGKQFERPKPRACTKCHESAESFSVLSFDHDRESRFPLDEAHEAVACAKCHTPDEKTEVIRYRPMSRECVDCHGVHERTLRRRQRRR